MRKRIHGNLQCIVRYHERICAVGVTELMQSVTFLFVAVIPCVAPTASAPTWSASSPAVMRSSASSATVHPGLYHETDPKVALPARLASYAPGRRLSSGERTRVLYLKD